MNEEVERRPVGGHARPTSPSRDEDRRRLAWLLGERVKELTALHQVARLITGDTGSVEETLSAVVALIPPAFQFPALTQARASYGAVRVVSPAFDDGARHLSASHTAKSGGVFRLDVAYVGAGAEAKDFLAEEQTLVDSIAQLVGAAIERGEAQERLELAVTGTGAGVWEWDLENGTVIWSPQMEQIAGLEPGTFGGTIEAFRALTDPADSERMQLAMQRAVSDPRFGYAVDFRLRRPNGEWRWISTRGQFFRRPNGRASRVLGLALDITERRLLEDQLRQSQKLEAIGSLAAGIAHDFNNMLSIVLSYADFMLLDLGAQAAMRGDLEEIKAAAVRASELTRHLLAFSRQQVLEPRVLDLNEAVGGLEKMLRRLLTESVEVRFSPSASLGRISADASQLEQVLINLVVNARDAMPNGGTLSIETADVELDAAYAAQHVDVTPGRYVMLAVTDTGVGMEPEVAARIFEPFFTTKGAGKGTGLGLASVFGFVRQSGGHIWVYSELGRGTCFKLYLPRVDRPADAPRDAAKTSERSLEGTESVLLVEDDESVRALARTILRRSGYTVFEARTSDEALSACTEHASELRLLLTDTILPGMSGPDLAARLTTIAPGLKVLHMSGYADAAIINHKILERGAAFIQKPLTPRALLLKVRDILDGGAAP